MRTPTPIGRRGLIVALAALTLALYAFRLGHSPPQLHSAEVMFALQADAIAETARDIHGRILPLYFQMQPLGEHTWWHPVIVYWMALWFQLLDRADWAVRLPTVVIGLIDVVLIFFVARRLFNDARWAFAAAAFLAGTPAHYMQSRIAMDYIYPVPFTLGWLLCLLVYLDRRAPWVLFVGGSLLGIGFYSYLAAVVMMPLYVAITCVVLFLRSPHWRRDCALVVAGFVWPLTALAFWLASHPTIVTDTLYRYPGTRAGIGLAMVMERISLFWSYFDPAFLFITGGYSSVLNSTRLVGAFLAPMMVLVPAGLWSILTSRRDIRHWLIAAGFLTAPVSACLVPEPYAIDREMVVVVFGALLGAYGLAHLVQSSDRRARVTARILVALAPVHFAFFLWVYFGEYRARSASWFDGNHRAATAELVAREAESARVPIYLNSVRIPFIEGYWRLALVQSRREDLLAQTVYFNPEEIDAGSIPRGALILMTRDDQRLQKMIAAGELQQLAEIPEIADPVFYVIAER